MIKKSTDHYKANTFRHNKDYFEANKIKPDYKQVEVLEKFVSDRGKISPRSRTGLSAKNQKRLAIAVKRARHLALLPFVA